MKTSISAAVAAVGIMLSSVTGMAIAQGDHTDLSERFDYPSAQIDVCDARLQYYEGGQAAGRPIVFVHGIPMWAYMWRNVMPELEGSGRLVAIDLPGFGSSQLGSAETFADQIHYFERFIEQMELEDIVLVLQDMGGGVGLSYAARNPDNVAGIVMMEIPVRQLHSGTPVDGAVFPLEVSDGWRDFIMTMRDPEAGHERLVVQNSFFGPDNANFARIARRTMSDTELSAYSAPLSDQARREFLPGLPASIAIDGAPRSSARRVQLNNEFLTSTDIPQLLFSVDDGGLIPPELAARMEAQIPVLERVHLGAGGHLVTEDYPREIGQSIAVWLREHALDGD